MGRKRKNEAVARLDEADRTLYTSFRGAANALSQLYTQSVTQQKLSFQAGERHAMDKLYHWIVRQHEEGSRVTVSDILSRIQHEMEYSSIEVPLSPRTHSQAAAQFANPSFNSPQANLFSQPRMNIPEQSRNAVFSNALSSPVRRSLQSYHISQGDGYCSNSESQPSAGGQNNSSSCNDSSMDVGL